VIVGAAAQDLVKPTEGWALHIEIDEARKEIMPMSFSFLTSDAGARETFMMSVQAVRKYWINTDRPDWPSILSIQKPTIDDVLKTLRK
jgi:hypothetical protein